MDPIGGRDRDGARIRPDFGVDVGIWMETKRRMLAAHQSQVAWVAKQHGVSNYVQSMEDWTARRGRDFGVPFAEGFRQYRHHPYPTTPALETLLGDAVREFAG